MTSDGILRGRSSEFTYPKVSFGKIVFDSLKSANQNNVILIDGFSRESLTYGEILRRSIQMAIGLQKMGIGRNDVVGLLSENSLDFLIPVIACFYIGAIVNPINNGYTTREIKFAFGITKPKVVFVSETCLKSMTIIKDEVDYIENIIAFGEGVQGIHSFDDVLNLGDENVNDFEPVDVDVEEQDAVVLCSSGTTGLPKGVMLTHNNLRCATCYLRDPIMLGFSENKSTIALLPMYHIFGLLVTVAALMTSTKIVMLEKFKPDVFLRIIEEFRITDLYLVPPLALFLAKSPLVEQYDVSSLKGIFCGAAPLGVEVQHLLENRMDVFFRQGYGLTETGGLVTCSPYGQPVKAGSCGMLVNETIAKVIDLETKEKLGPNQKGELCVKSPMNTKGYLNNPSANKDIFDDEGYIRTGDIGYYDEDEYFYIVDRLKELIKYKGFQVPPAEIEDILMSHEGIKEAGVIGVPDERCGELPIAFVVKQPKAKITEEDVVSFVAEHVSVPKQLHGGVRFIDEIPKSATGKILRKHLKALLNIN